MIIYIIHIDCSFFLNLNTALKSPELETTWHDLHSFMKSSKSHP